MATIDMSCTACGARVVTQDVAEVIEWDRAHGQRCTKAADLPVPGAAGEEER